MKISKESVEKLRKLWLFFESVYIFDELGKKRKWLLEIMQDYQKDLGFILKGIEPKRRLPDFLLDTPIGRASVEALKNCEELKPESLAKYVHNHGPKRNNNRRKVVDR